MSSDTSTQSRFAHLFNDHQTEEETRALIEQCAREMYGIKHDQDKQIEKLVDNDWGDLDL